MNSALDAEIEWIVRVAKQESADPRAIVRFEI